MAFWKASLEAIGGFDPQFRDRRRRRRHLLAPAGAGLDGRLQPRRGRLAPPPRLDRAATSSSSTSTARPRRCSSASGRSATTASATSPGPAASTATPPSKAARRRAGRSTTAPGARASSSPSTSARPGSSRSLPLMPEWYLVIAALAGPVGARASLWSPLLLALPLLARSRSARSSSRPALGGAHGDRSAAAEIARWRDAAAARCAPRFLYMLQPLARLAGRLRYGLSPWRRRSAPRLGAAGAAHAAASGASTGVRPTSALARHRGGAAAQTAAWSSHGGDFERWDLHVRGGMLGSMRLRVAVEEHGAGRQLVRIRSWPRFSRHRAGARGPASRRSRPAPRSTARWIAAAILGAARCLAGLRRRSGTARPRPACCCIALAEPKPDDSAAGPSSTAAAAPTAPAHGPAAPRRRTTARESVPLATTGTNGSPASAPWVTAFQARA